MRLHFARQQKTNVVTFEKSFGCSETLMGFETPQMTSHMVAGSLYVKRIVLRLRWHISAFLPCLSSPRYRRLEIALSPIWCLSSLANLCRLLSGRPLLFRNQSLCFVS
jgi:hypothetical protein